MIYSRFTRARVGRFVVMLGVASRSFTLGTYAKDVSISDAKHDENLAGYFMNETMAFHTFVADIINPGRPTWAAISAPLNKPQAS